MPELNPVAAAFAGVVGVGLSRFVLGAVATATIWAGAWIAIGYLIASTTWGGGGSGIPLFVVIVAASAITSLVVMIRPAARAITTALRSRQIRAPALHDDASVHADCVARRRKSTC
jgi:membrane protein DedA with SNARE-associated domain